MTDAVGAPLPRLSHREERRLVANALLHHIEIAATACELGVVSITPRQNEGSAHPERRRLLSALLKPFVQLFGRKPTTPVQPEPFDVSLDILCRWAREVIELPVAESAELSSRLTFAFEQLAAEYPQASDEWNAANTLATNFRTHHLIVVEVPGPAATRHIFRVMYSEAIVHDRGGRIGKSAVGTAYRTIWLNENWWHRARRWRALRLLGWPFASPSRERLVELPTCTYGERHHVQILCPSGMRLVRGEAGWVERLEDGTTRLGGVVQDDDRQPSKVHLFLPRNGSDKWGTAMARVHLYPNAVGVITSTFITALLCLAVGVVSGGLVFGWSPSAWWDAGGWPQGNIPFERDAAAAVLLVLPTAALVFLFRYDEPDLIGSVLRRTRVTFLLASLPIAVLGVFITFQNGADAPGRWWVACVGVAVLGCACLGVQGLTVWRRTRREDRRGFGAQ